MQVREVHLGPFAINSTVPECSGVYTLFDILGQLLYVGRSDSDLRQRLHEHLPALEGNPVLRKRFVWSARYLPLPPLDAWYFESRLYFDLHPPANFIAPARPQPDLRLPYLLQMLDMPASRPVDRPFSSNLERMFAARSLSPREHATGILG